MLPQLQPVTAIPHQSRTHASACTAAPLSRDQARGSAAGAAERSLQLLPPRRNTPVGPLPPRPLPRRASGAHSYSSQTVDDAEGLLPPRPTTSSDRHHHFMYPMPSQKSHTVESSCPSSASGVARRSTGRSDPVNVGHGTGCDGPAFGLPARAKADQKSSAEFTMPCSGSVKFHSPLLPKTTGSSEAWHVLVWQIAGSMCAKAGAKERMWL
mmetsp:Transcript_2160/g.6417  ORF Transcript_2160/g.6417 Transcript_2160/m.6417 type:complete len:211 (+) Transcript_2160:38-670(+)